MASEKILFFGEVLGKIRILNIVLKPRVPGPDKKDHKHSIQLTVNKYGISILRGISELKIPFEGTYNYEIYCV